MPVMIPLNALDRAPIARSPRLRERVTDVLETGWYALGPALAAFEDALGRYLGGSTAVAGVASGTDGLRLGLQALGCRNGSTVLAAPNAGGYTAIAAAALGARVRVADVDPETHVLTPESVADAWHEDVEIVVLTHLYGNIADAAPIVDWCQVRGVKVLEDCAQAAGGQREGTSVGTIGDAASFSFYPTKNLGAAGDGGAVASRDLELIDRIRSLRQYGWSEKYVITMAGGANSRLDEIQAAVLLESIDELDERNRRRVGIAARYRTALAAGPFRLVTQTRPGSVAHLAVVQAPSPPARVSAREALHAMGIATDVHYPVLDHLQEGLADVVLHASTPHAEFACSTVFTVPCFPELSESEVCRIEEALVSLDDRCSP